MLHLPTELIQLILLQCETPDFFQAAQACRRLYDIARGSREVILHRLYHTPGWIDDLDTLPTNDLYTILRCRSNAQLDGAETSTFTTYGFPKAIDSRASAFESPRESNRALLVFKNHSTVYLVKMHDGKLIQEAKWASPGQDTGEVEVIQAAFDGDHGVYVLHRYKPFPDQELDTDHPFVQHAMQSHPNGSIFLAYHDLNLENTTVHMSAFPEHQDYNPLALAVAGDQFAISWQNAQEPSDHAVVLYQVHEFESEDEDDESSEDDDSEDDSNKELRNVKIVGSCDPRQNAPYNFRRLMNPRDRPIQGVTGPPVKLAFNDRGFQLLYHYRAQSLYGSFRALHTIPTRGQAGPQIANRCTVPFTPNLSLQFSIGIPFFATHEAGNIANGVPCHWQYLAFGTATHRVENWTVACLLKSEAFPTRRCTHVSNLDRGRRFENWKVMAQLGGFQESTTSHGSQVATSRLGTRIAIADWKTLYVWALNPTEVLDPESTFYPSSWLSPTNTIVLRPVVLDLGAVCSQIRFTAEEHELVAITDRGVVHVDLNSRCQLERNELSMDLA
ncbi:hypothetical protein N7541_010727 [Penicillium brevicompactum]|uniref:F-box domain-containing protein n=1 Tax=Penicillium brevicompactum TaxID=5074 RepID=A0A9W9QV33_PENBR|nr:hypothetical protein N7541_010727 [Penicillium brevicompactum]